MEKLEEGIIDHLRNVKKRRSTHTYICDRCGWEGEGVIKVQY